MSACSGGEAGQLLPLWRRLRAEHERSGLWPLIMGADDYITDPGGDYGQDGDRQVAADLAMDAAARLGQPRAAILADLDDDDSGYELPPRGDASGLRPDGDEDGFVLAGKPGWIGLVRADAGHLVPGLLTWAGATNYGMDAADHVAILRRWHDQYGAELVGLGRDVIELRVPNPPADHTAALAVAEEQYWYCPDIVDQGVETIDALAVVQVPTRRWFFWWD